MTDRRLTDEELAEIAATPRERFLAALDAGAPEEAWFAVDRSFRGFADGFDAWAATIVAHELDRHGPAAAGRLLDHHDVLDTAHGSGLSDADRWVVAERELPRPEPSDDAAWLAAYDRLEEAWRRVHDARVDRVALLLTRVYDTYGIEELEASLRVSGAATLVARLERDVARDPEDRLRRLAAGLGGNFAEIEVEETEDAFVIRQDPCGTCGRQLARGRYRPAGPLAVVEEVSALTWGRGATPIYRCHVPVMHFLMPGERIGIPWPEIVCPEGSAIGPCTIRIAKDPGAVDPALADPTEAARRLRDEA